MFLPHRPIGWVGNEEYIYVNGDQKNFTRTISCWDHRGIILDSNSPVFHPVQRCDADDSGFSDRYQVRVSFLEKDIVNADFLIDQTEAALRTVFVACATPSAKVGRKN